MEVTIIEGESIEFLVNMPVGINPTTYTSVSMQARINENTAIVIEKTLATGIATTSNSFVVSMNPTDTSGKSGYYKAQFKLVNATETLILQKFSFIIEPAINK